MKQTIFKGSGVAIITPMLEDGSVNYPVLKELLEQPELLEMPANTPVEYSIKR